MNKKINMKKSSNFKKRDLLGYIRQLEEENIKEILELHPIIMNNLDNEDLFYFDNYEFYKYHLENEGVILGCYINEVLIGYGVMIIPKYDDENLGYDLKLPQDELLYVAHLDSVAIHPDFRGNKLQVKIFSMLEEIAKQRGYKHLCSTVSPQNIYSIKNLEILGLEKRLEKLKYRGKNRYIYYKFLH